MTMPDPEEPKVRKRSPRASKRRKKKTRKKTARVPVGRKAPLDRNPDGTLRKGHPREPDPRATASEPAKVDQGGLSEVELVHRAIADLYAFVGRRNMPGLRPKVLDLDHSFETVMKREGLI